MYERTNKFKIERVVSDVNTVVQTIYSSFRTTFKDLNWNNEGMHTDGKKLNNLRIVDDIILVADNPADQKRWSTN